MRRLFFSALLVIASLACIPHSAVAQSSEWKQIPIPSLHKFQPAQPKRIALPNGMVIFLQEDHELPFIEGTALIRGGSRDEVAGKAGLVELYGDVWRTGGTKGKTGDALDDFLEARAAKVETNGDLDLTSISFSCLKGDLNEVFSIFTDFLRQPEFRAEKLDLAKDQAYTAISRRNDSVQAIAAREARKLAYGAKNPYARDYEYATIATVTRQDLLDWHTAHVHPNNVLLGITGDFDAAAIETKLRETFAGWAKGPAIKTPAIEFQPAKPGYYLVEKKDVNQTNIRMVEPGIRRDNPDFFAIEVFNEAFGGGFSARLISNVRTRKGLAYSVGGGIGSSFDHTGLTRLSMGTKSQSTVEAINALYAEIDGLAGNPLTDDEIRNAKDSILNSFIFNLDSPDKVLRERMTYEFYGYPTDFLDKYRSGIEKVTAADVARIPGKYLHKDKLAVLVVGNPAEFDKALTTLGPVTAVDITIPEPPQEAEGRPAQ